MTTKKLFLIAGLAAVFLTGCKTTENNYRSAYEVALQKRQNAEDEDTDLMQGVKVIKESDLRTQVIDGDPVPVRVTVGSVLKGPQNQYSVIIARYKLNTNAIAHYESLAKKDTTAALIQTAEDEFLIAPSSSKKIEDAAKAWRKVVGKGQPQATVSLPDGPYVLRLATPR